MRNIKRAAAAVLAVITVLGVAPMSHAAEGCVASNSGLVGVTNTCEYVASRPGSIGGAGFWTVEVWWNGVCGSGAPNWVRDSFAGTANNGPGGVAGSWEGSIATGSCARATAWTPGTAVVIGDPLPAQGGTDGDQTMDDHACRDASVGAHVVQGQNEQGHDDYGRGSVCVSDGDSSNGADLYVGGEFLTEKDYGPNGEFKSCGGIEVAGQQGPGVDPSQERFIFGDDGWGGASTSDACQ